MVILGGLRPFERLHDGIQVRLRLEDWPTDVPLPAESAIARVGENHEIPLHPYWRIVLEPERTVEAIAGQFIFPLSLDAAIAWYQSEMAKCGWIELTEKGYRMPASAALHFEHPASNVRVVVGLRDWLERKVSDAFIRRIVEHPWSPPSNGNPSGTLRRSAGANAKPSTHTSKAKKRRVQHTLALADTQVPGRCVIG